VRAWHFLPSFSFLFPPSLHTITHTHFVYSMYGAYGSPHTDAVTHAIVQVLTGLVS
jgi:hypothetical protein